ncbi:MAG: hypothetical protein KGH55_03335 [Nanoarchaeota archaeon]|nr:hypothetical protein [Nanoarchaeota archaeon]
MVLQYRKKGERWKKYPGKEKIAGDVKDYNFRLLNEVQTKILVEEGPYDKVMKRFRQIEFFKHH